MNGKTYDSGIALGGDGKVDSGNNGKNNQNSEKKFQFVALLGIFEKAARIVYFQHAKRPHFTNLVSEIRKLFILYFRK